MIPVEVFVSNDIRFNENDENGENGENDEIPSVSQRPRDHLKELGEKLAVSGTLPHSFTESKNMKTYERKKSIPNLNGSFSFSAKDTTEPSRPRMSLMPSPKIKVNTPKEAPDLLKYRHPTSIKTVDPLPLPTSMHIDPDLEDNTAQTPGKHQEKYTQDEVDFSDPGPATEDESEEFIPLKKKKRITGKRVLSLKSRKRKLPPQKKPKQAPVVITLSDSEEDDDDEDLPIVENNCDNSSQSNYSQATSFSPNALCKGGKIYQSETATQTVRLLASKIEYKTQEGKKSINYTNSLWVVRSLCIAVV